MGNEEERDELIKSRSLVRTLLKVEGADFGFRISCLASVSGQTKPLRRWHGCDALRTGATRELLKNISFFLRILLRFSGDIP
jgi:hypothetical protein